MDDQIEPPEPTIFQEFAEWIEMNLHAEVTLDELKDIFQKGIFIDENLSLEDQAAAWRMLYRLLQITVPDSPWWKKSGTAVEAATKIIQELVVKANETRIIVPGQIRLDKPKQL